FLLSINFCDLLRWLSTSTIRNITLSLFLNFEYSSFMDGISAMHGGHHVAQKLINTTLPFKSTRSITSPSGFLNKISSVLLLALKLAASAPVGPWGILGWNKPIFIRFCDT